MSAFLTPQGGSDEDCCCNGLNCTQCSFTFENCRISWFCPDDRTTARLYRGDNLLAEARFGVIGNPQAGTYRLEQFCNNLFIGQKQLVVTPAQAIICADEDCCVSLGKSPCDTLVATISGFPDFPGFLGMNGTHVLDCVFAQDGFGCDYSLSRTLAFTDCTGPQGAIDPTLLLGRIDWFFGVSIQADGQFNFGITGEVYLRRDVPPCQQVSWIRINNTASNVGVGGCFLPMRNVPVPVLLPAGNAVLHNEFGSYFGPLPPPVNPWFTVNVSIS